MVIDLIQEVRVTTASLYAERCDIQTSLSFQPLRVLSDLKFPQSTISFPIKKKKKKKKAILVEEKRK